jgi:hypothetical protein
MAALTLPVVMAMAMPRARALGDFGRLSLLLVGFLLAAGCGLQCELYLRSPDGRYQALEVGSRPDIHYQITEIATGRVILTTRAQYPTPNDVKAGTFSPDSQEFAAAYHYDHPPRGRYTWIGIWSLNSGALIRPKEPPGWLTAEICREFVK